MRALIVLVVLLGASHAEAGRSWWEQFYVYAGYREVEGVGRASGRTLAIGYRLERERWGVDVAAFDHTSGLEEGLHQLVRVAAYRAWHRWWIGGGVSYALLDGWTTTSVPHRTGQGLAVDAVAGVELGTLGLLRPFVQVDVAVPTFTARDRYDSMDSAVRSASVELAVGLRF